VEKVPAPLGDVDAPLQALIIDSWFDSYLGVVSLVRVKNGTLKTGEKMHVMSTGQSHIVTGVGVFTPKRTDTGCLKAGEVGYVIAGIKHDIWIKKGYPPITVPRHKGDIPIGTLKSILKAAKWEK